MWVPVRADKLQLLYVRSSAKDMSLTLLFARHTDVCTTFYHYRMLYGLHYFVLLFIVLQKTLVTRKGQQDIDAQFFVVLTLLIECRGPFAVVWNRVNHPTSIIVSSLETCISQEQRSVCFV